MSLFYGAALIFRNRSCVVCLEGPPDTEPAVVIGYRATGEVVTLHPGDKWIDGSTIVDDLVRQYGRRRKIGAEERRLVREFLKAGDRVAPEKASSLARPAPAISSTQGRKRERRRDQNRSSSQA